MTWNLPFKVEDVLLIMAVLAAIGGLLSVVLVIWVAKKVKRITLPEGASFLTALRATPFLVVVLLDLLDLSIDFFAAPFAWSLLGYLGLAPLRTVTVVESLIPGTQFLPTMTLAWLAARYIIPRTD